MKKLSLILFCAVSLFFMSNAFAQEMNADAGKLYNAGNSMLKAGNYNGAIDNYTKALAIEKDYRIYYQLGVAQKKSRKLDDAKNSFENCIKVKSEFANAYNALGGVYFQLGNFQEAINNFEKVLTFTKNAKIQKKIKKNLSLAYTKLGNKALSNGNATKGIEALKSAVKNYHYDAAYLSLAKVYSEMGEYDKSISAAENALKYRSKITKGGPYFYMGVSYKGKGDTAKAKEMFTNAKKDRTYKKTAEYELSSLN